MSEQILFELSAKVENALSGINKTTDAVLELTRAAKETSKATQETATILDRMAGGAKDLITHFTGVGSAVGAIAAAARLLVKTLDDIIDRGTRAANAVVTVSQLEAQAVMGTVPGSRLAMEAGGRAAEAGGATADAYWRAAREARAYVRGAQGWQEVGGIVGQFAPTGEPTGALAAASARVGNLLGIGPRGGLGVIAAQRQAGNIPLETIEENLPGQLGGLLGTYTAGEILGMESWMAGLVGGPQGAMLSERLLGAMKGGAVLPGGRRGTPLIPGWEKMSMLEVEAALGDLSRRDPERIMSTLARPGEPRNMAQRVVREYQRGNFARPIDVSGPAVEHAIQVLVAEVEQVPGQDLARQQAQAGAGARRIELEVPGAQIGAAKERLFGGGGMTGLLSQLPWPQYLVASALFRGQVGLGLDAEGVERRLLEQLLEPETFGRHLAPSIQRGLEGELRRLNARLDSGTQPSARLE